MFSWGGHPVRPVAVTKNQKGLKHPTQSRGEHKIGSASHGTIQNPKSKIQNPKSNNEACIPVPQKDVFA